MKIAIVHDWLIHMRGGERVLECIAELYPDATMHTLFYDRSKLSPALQRMKFKASPLQNLPGIKHYYRWLLPFFPKMIESIPIDADTELVLSSSHCVAKGIKIPKGPKHICYINTPMRYLWVFEEEYFGKFSSWFKSIIRFLMNPLKKWDLATNKAVDLFISNSQNIRARLKKVYQCESDVIYPPYDSSKFYPSSTPKEDFYLVVSAFVPYKRVDLVIETFNELDRKLVIVGSGPLEKAYKSLKRSDKISFLGSIDDAALCKVYSQARALIFPTYEDFGIVPLEAQACGTPVIAYGKGGALETVKSGLFFSEQTKESLRQAILEFETKKFDRALITSQIKSFDKEFFKQQFRETIERIFPKAKTYASVS